MCIIITIPVTVSPKPHAVHNNITRVLRSPPNRLYFFFLHEYLRRRFLVSRVDLKEEKSREKNDMERILLE